MKMHRFDIAKAVIRDESYGLNTWDKYFLIKTILLFGDGLVTDSLSNLQARFGMPVARMSKAIDRLCMSRGKDDRQSGYLVLEQEEKSEIRWGRPRRKFKVSSDYLYDVELRYLLHRKDEGSSALNDRIIEDLILGAVGAAGLSGRVSAGGKGNAPDRTGAKDKLQRNNRFLLAVLWALADEFGVVRDVGVSSIARMAGMTRDQVDGQLIKLHRLQYVHSRIGGLSASRIFGRSKGAVFLNPLHTSLPQPVEDGKERSWLYMKMDEGVLGALGQAFSTADVIHRQVSGLSTRKRLLESISASEQGGGRRSGRLKRQEDNEREVQEEILRFERLPAGINVKKVLDGVGAGVTESGVPINLYRAFCGAKYGVRAYAVLVICRYATRMLKLNPKGCLKGGCLDQGILADIREEVCAKGWSGEGEQERGLSLAAWFYCYSQSLAAEMLRWRVRDLNGLEGVESSEGAERLVDADTLAEEGRYLLVPSSTWGTLAVLASERKGLKENSALLRS